MRHNFDQQVTLALEKWPDVPACYGWLSLNRRGRWLIKEQAISHNRAIEFLARNYACDELGQWFVQNGPQRAYCALDYTPWVYHFDGKNQIFTHTKKPASEMRGLVIDDAGDILFDTEHGIGLLDNRDLARFLDILEKQTGNPTAADEIASLAAGLNKNGNHEIEIEWYGRPTRIRTMLAADVAGEFGFDAAPSEVST